MTMVVVSTPLRRLTGRHAIPIRRQVMDAVQDFSMTATAESRAIRDLLAVAQKLCLQTPPRPDLAVRLLVDATERAERITRAGRALSAQADAEATREVPDHAA